MPCGTIKSSRVKQEDKQNKQTNKQKQQQQQQIYIYMGAGYQEAVLTCPEVQPHHAPRQDNYVELDARKTFLPTLRYNQIRSEDS